MAKMNCWEFKNCGRQPQGPKADEMGLCPASTDTRLDGIHDGVNSGRACWVISGTLCNGEEQGTFAIKEGNCTHCDFYKVVVSEEGSHFHIASDLLKRVG